MKTIEEHQYGGGDVWGMRCMQQTLEADNGIYLYACTLKSHNVCKRHIAIGTGFKQTEHFSACYFIGIIINAAQVPRKLIMV